MRTRKWMEEDTNRVISIYRKMEMPYRMPDVTQPLFQIKRVLEDDSGNVIGAGAIKPIGECFLWVRPDLLPVMRARAVKRLTGEAMLLGSQAGFDELSAWIPPNVEKNFGLPLTKLGFRMSPWRCWSVTL